MAAFVTFETFLAGAKDVAMTCHASQCIFMSMTHVDELFAAKLEPIVRSLHHILEGGGWDDGVLASFIDATQSLPPQTVPSLEAKIRAASWTQVPPLRITKKTSMKEILKWAEREKPHRFIVPWFDIFSHDGFRRENALRTVREGAPSAFLLAVFLRRLNDWVPQVRLAAKEAIDDVLARTNTQIIIEALWYTLPSRGSIGRLKGAEARVLDQIPVREEVVEGLAERVKVASAGPALLVLRQALRQPGLERFLPDLARNSIQPAVRAAAYKALIEQRIGWQDGWKWKWVDKSLGLRKRQPMVAHRSFSVQIDLATIIEEAISDPAVFVKRVGADGLIAH